MVSVNRSFYREIFGRTITGFGVIAALVFTLWMIWLSWTNFERGMAAHQNLRVVFGTSDSQTTFVHCLIDNECRSRFGIELNQRLPLANISACGLDGGCFAVLPVTIFAFFAILGILVGRIKFESRFAGARWETWPKLKALSQGAGYLGLEEKTKRVLRIPGRDVQNIMIDGTMGEGKTIGMLYTQILSQMQNNCGHVVWQLKTNQDGRGDFDLLISAAQMLGFPVYRFTPFSPGSDRLNLLATVTTIERATAMADALVPYKVDNLTEFYSSTERSFLAHLMLDFAKQGCDFRDLYFFFTRGGASIADYVLNNAALRPHLAGTLDKGKARLADTYSKIAEMLAIFNQDTVAAATGRSGGKEFSLLKMLQTPSLLIIGMPEGSPKSAAGQFLTNFIFELIEDAIDTTIATKKNRALDFRLQNEIDELDGWGRINGLKDPLSKRRSANVGYTLVVQSIEQLYATYRSEEAKVIQAMCSVKVTFARGMYGEPALDLERALGMREIIDTSLGESNNAGGVSTNRTMRARKEPLLPVGAMAELPAGSAIVRLKGFHPIRVWVPKFFERTSPVYEFARRAKAYGQEHPITIDVATLDAPSVPTLAKQARVQGGGVDDATNLEAQFEIEPKVLLAHLNLFLSELQRKGYAKFGQFEEHQGFMFQGCEPHPLLLDAGSLRKTAELEFSLLPSAYKNLSESQKRNLHKLARNSQLLRFVEVQAKAIEGHPSFENTNTVAVIIGEKILLRLEDVFVVLGKGSVTPENLKSRAVDRDDGRWYEFKLPSREIPSTEVMDETILPNVA